MVGRNTALQAAKGGGGVPGARPVLTATLGPRTPAMDTEVESIFASLVELFDEPSPARHALLHEDVFGKAAKQTGTRPRVTRPPVKVVPRVALPKAHEDEADPDQSQTVRIERPVIPAEALRSNPPATPAPQAPLSAQAGTSRSHPQPVTPAGSSAKAGPPPLPVSASQAIPALLKALAAPRPSPRPRAASADPRACPPERVTPISTRPPVTRLEASAQLAPPIVVIAPADAPPKAAPAAQPLPAESPWVSRASAAPSKATVVPAPIDRPRRRAWIAVASAAVVVVLGFAGWRGALAREATATPAIPAENVPEPAPIDESAPAEPTLLIADTAASPAPAEPVAPSPQPAPPAAAIPAHGPIHLWAPSGVLAPAARKTLARPAPPAAPAAEPAPSAPPKAARTSGPLIPLEEDSR